MSITVNGVTDPTTFTKAEFMALKNDPNCNWGADAIAVIEEDFELTFSGEDPAESGEEPHGEFRHYQGKVEGFEMGATIEQLEGDRYYISVEIASEGGTFGFGSF